MAKSQRDRAITALINETSSALGNLTRWPDSEATIQEVDLAIKKTRKTISEDSYPDVVLYLIAVQIASNIWYECASRDVKFQNFRGTWLKLAELFA
jgi:hypothetical protein